MRRWLVASLGLILSTAAWAGDGLAVLYFDNQGNPPLEPLKVGLAQMLITDLREIPGVDVVERSRIQEVLDEIELGHSGKVDEVTAARIGKLVGARWMVMGGFFELGGTLRIDARLVEVETGKIVFASGVNDASHQFMGLEKRLALDLRDALAEVAPKAGKVGPSPATKPSPSVKPTLAPPSPSPASPKRRAADGAAPAERKPFEAALKYSEGLMALDKKDVDRARDSFERAVAADPDWEAAQEQLSKLSL